MYLISVLYPAKLLDWLVPLLSILVILVVVSRIGMYVRLLGMLMLGIGLWLLAAHGAGWGQVLLSFGRMMNILSLFALVPLIALPIELGRYALRIRLAVARRVKTSGLLYMITSGLTYIASSFMSLGAMPMMYQTMKPSMDLYPIGEKERFISRSITHGFAMPTVWTPVTPIVGIVVEMTGVRWLHIIPILIPFSLLGLAADCLIAFTLSKRRRRQLAAISEMSGKPERDDAGDAALLGTEAADNGRMTEEGAAKGAHPSHILLAVVALNGLISLLESRLHLGFLLLVTLTVIPFALVWSLLLGQGRAFLSLARERLPQHLGRMKEQFYMFLCAGFMITAIQSTGATHVINTALGAIKQTVGAELFILLIPLIPLGLAFAGLQPAVALALAAEAMNPTALGVSVEIAAIAMLTGAAAAFMMGPYNATASMMAGLINRSAYKVSNWNLPFTAAYIGMVTVLLIVLELTG
ncbi:hypothetical protein [Paenibacillus daejeonensis]|uniref:hypothetical protein n=1 Tax=Paenibacillus daejeonensis TaxID=135193 RepID=UPI00035F1FC7|nr:hypothetical protein [Paenibacillus daejeonensis]